MFWTLSQALTELAENVWLYSVVDKDALYFDGHPSFQFYTYTVSGLVLLITHFFTC
jgi:hypothetical protein